MRAKGFNWWAIKNKKLQKCDIGSGEEEDDYILVMARRQHLVKMCM